jgi:predicted RND superfamily exporter protein
MKKFAQTVLKLRMVVIVITVLVTLILGYFIKDLKINPDITSYLPKSDPAVKLFDYIGEKYGGNYLAIVALETDDIFSKETIERISELTNEFKLVDGVSYVTSLTNVLNVKKGEAGIEVGKLIDEYNLPQTDEELKKLKSYTLSKDMHRGRLVSDDSKATLIICRLREDVDKIKIAKQLKEIVKKMNLKAKVHYSGIPFQLMDISEIILNDLKFLVPIVSFLIIISLFFSFRSLRSVLLPILSVLISTIWTLGIMSILKVPLTVISDIIPVILIAIGTAYSIHVISKFDEELSTVEDKIKRAQNALSEVGVPVILAGVTTIAGFISFVFGSYLTAISQFGIFSSLGVLFALIISLTFTPSVLSLSSPKRKMIILSENFSKKNSVDKFMDKIGEWVLTNEKAIIVCAIFVVVLCFIGIPKIERRVDMLDYFSPKKPD